MDKRKIFEIFKTLYPYLMLAYLALWQMNSLYIIEKGHNDLFIYVANITFFLLLAFWNQKVLKSILVASFLLLLFVYPSIKIYGQIDASLLASLLFTNVGEGTSYITTIPPKVLSKLIILLIFTLILVFSNFKKPKNKNIKFFLLGYLLILPIITFFTRGEKRYEDIRKVWYCQVSPVKYGIYITQTLYELKKENDFILEQGLLPDDWKVLNPNEVELKNNFVIVVGESLRRDFMHKYGFPIENTPFIDSSKNISFTNFLSTATHTMITLKRALAYCDTLSKPHINNSIIKLARKVGYESHWVSNQGFIGLYDSPLSIFAKSCDHLYNLNGGDYTRHKNDFEIIPIFEDILKEKPKKPKLIFLHMIGSHPSPCTITGGKYDEYYISESISCYSKTIRDTDAFLAKVYEILEKTNEPYTFIYFSDHGTGINEDLAVVHAEKVQEGYEIPLLIWENTLKEAKTINTLRNSRDLIYLFTELNNIKTANFKRNYRFISEDEDHNANVVLNSNGSYADYYKLDTNPIPHP